MSDVAPVGESTASRWEDLIDIFYAPSSVFARREGKDVWLPLIMLAALMALLTWANRGLLDVITDVEFSRMSESILQKNPEVPLEQIRKGQDMMASFRPVMAVVGVPIATLFIASMLWLCARLVDAKLAFGSAALISTFAMFPRLIEQVVNGIQWLVLPAEAFNSRFSTTLGVGRLLDPDGAPFLLAVVGRIDVFTLWVTALLAIGLAVKSRIPLARAAIAAALVWLLGMIPTLYSAAQM